MKKITNPLLTFAFNEDREQVLTVFDPKGDEVLAIAYTEPDMMNGLGHALIQRAEMLAAIIECDLSFHDAMDLFQREEAVSFGDIKPNVDNAIKLLLGESNG